MVHGTKSKMLATLCIFVGVLVSFKRVKYFVTEGDEPAELCLEKLGDVSSAVTVAVSSRNDRAFGMTLLLVLHIKYASIFLHSSIRLYSCIQFSDHIPTR